jgi:hypothetical protein
LSIAAGTSGSTTLTAARVSYNGNITLANSGQPGDMQVGYSENPMTGNTTTITVTVGSGVAPGLYNLTISGTTSGAGSPSVPLQVMVTAAPPGLVDFIFRDAAFVPVWFGYKDGNGPWTQVQPTSSGGETRFSFNITSATGAVAYTQPTLVSLNDADRRIAKALRVPLRAVQRMGPTRLRARVLAAARASARGSFANSYQTTEVRDVVSGLRAYGATVDDDAVVQWGVTSGLSLNMPAADNGVFGCGGYSTSIFSSDAGYNLTTAAGLNDCIALRTPTSQSDYFFGAFYRGVPAPGTRDINWAAHLALTRVTITATNGPAGAQYAFAEGVETGTGETGFFPLQQPINAVPSRTAFVMPGTTAGDNHVLNITALSSTSTTQVFIDLARYMGTTFGTQDVPLPNEVAPFTVTESVGAMNENLFGTTVAAPSGFESTVSFQVAGAAGTIGVGNSYAIIASKEWMAVNGNTLAMQSKANAGFPAGAFLQLPREFSAVQRLATNITGTVSAGSFLSIVSRAQVP